MIRDVVMHLMSEQPLLADLDALPTPSDNLIICSNLRLMNGNRPIFVDDSASTFVFPVEFVRFIEIPPRALAGLDLSGRGDGEGANLPAVRRDEVGAAAGTSTADDAGTDPGADDELEIDEDFLRRIRDV